MTDNAARLTCLDRQELHRVNVEFNHRLAEGFEEWAKTFCPINVLKYKQIREIPSPMGKPHVIKEMGYGNRVEPYFLKYFNEVFLMIESNRIEFEYMVREYAKLMPNGQQLNLPKVTMVDKSTGEVLIS